jgi:hypothetical protein
VEVVVPHLMSPSLDGLNDFRMGSGPLPDQKERGVRIMRREDAQHLGRVYKVRAIIERQRHERFARGYAPHDVRSGPLQHSEQRDGFGPPHYEDDGHQQKGDEEPPPPPLSHA